MKDNGNFPFLANQTGKLSSLWHHGKHSYNIWLHIPYSYFTFSLGFFHFLFHAECFNSHISFVHFALSDRLSVHTCEPSGGSIFLPILRVPFVPPVNFQNLPPVKKIKYNKILTYILRSIFLEIPHLELPYWEKTPRDTNVIFNDIRLLICLTPLQVNWVMVIN
jgi:hypothetical protein